MNLYQRTVLVELVAKVAAFHTTIRAFVPIVDDDENYNVLLESAAESAKDILLWAITNKTDEEEENGRD